jgi:hypothetical protein
VTRVTQVISGLGVWCRLGVVHDPVFLSRKRLHGQMLLVGDLGSGGDFSGSIACVVFREGM